MHCNFSKKEEGNDLEVKVGDVISQASKFKYLVLVLQNDGKINDVTRRIRSGWLKWRRTLGVLM